MTEQQFLHPTPREKAMKRRYADTKWRALSLRIRERDGQCMVRVSKKCSGRAEVADHIVRPEEGGEMYDMANLRAACRSCNFVRHNAKYFREKVDAAAAGALGPFTRPEPSPGRPESSDVDRFLAWAMSLHGVAVEPPDHRHGRWEVAPTVFTRAGAFHVCPASCASPVRWRVQRPA